MRGAHGVKTDRTRSEDPGLAISTTVAKLSRIESYLKKALEPIDDLLGSAEYKIYIAGVLLERALRSSAPERREKAGWKKWLNEPMICRCCRYASTSMARTGRARYPRKRRYWSSSGCDSVLRERSAPANLRFAVRAPFWSMSNRSAPAIIWHARRTGKSVLTIEGLSKDDVLDPLQEAFMRNIGAQCGFCTPGQIMSAKALLLANPSPSRQQITEWLSGNICRCGAYPAIVASVQEAAAELPNSNVR